MSDKKPTVDLIFQIGLCVEDMEATLENWKKYFDIDESTIVKKNTKYAFEHDGWNGHNYNEEYCKFFHKFCRFSLGGLDFEIIEPYDKTPGNPYSDFLVSNGGNGVHHLGVKIGNLPALNMEMKEIGKPRYNYAEMGPVLSDGTRKGNVFYDLRDALGVILECCSIVVGPLADDPRAGNPSDFKTD